MPAPYIMKSVWPDYTLNEVTYTFGHLAEMTFQTADSLGNERAIVVTFSDHVFTKEPEPHHTMIDAFPSAKRDPFGVLCTDRYQRSLELPALMQALPGQRIWNLKKDDRYAHVPVQNVGGETILYSIVFSIDRVTRNIPYDLHMYVRSAYPCDIKIPDTFGDVRFSHLLMLRMNDQQPQRNFSKNRKIPTLGSA